MTKAVHKKRKLIDDVEALRNQFSVSCSFASKQIELVSGTNKIGLLFFYLLKWRIVWVEYIKYWNEEKSRKDPGEIPEGSRKDAGRIPEESQKDPGRIPE